MRLYLIRHGEALGPEADPARPLSRSGRDEAERLGAYLGSLSLKISGIWHSTKLRAKDTAAIVNETAGFRAPLLERQGLSPNDSPEEILPEIDASAGDLCIVGHLPFLPALSARLVSDHGGESTWTMTTCGTICFERGRTGKWEKKWSVSPDRLEPK